jgi:hypothetical protein
VVRCARSSGSTSADALPNSVRKPTEEEVARRKAEEAARRQAAFQMALADFHAEREAERLALIGAAAKHGVKIKGDASTLCVRRPPPLERWHGPDTHARTHSGTGFFSVEEGSTARTWHGYVGH